MEQQNITNLESLKNILKENLGVVLYFSKMTCNVGEALEPKVNQLIKNGFPKMKYYFVDMDLNTEITSTYNVFIEPTILVFFDAKETIRKSRVFSVEELSIAIKRVYEIAF